MSIDRRDFLKVLGVTGAGATLALAIPCLLSYKMPPRTDAGR